MDANEDYTFQKVMETKKISKIQMDLIGLRDSELDRSVLERS